MDTFVIFIKARVFHRLIKRAGRAEGHRRLCSSSSKIYNEQRCKYRIYLHEQFPCHASSARTCAAVPKQQSLAQSHQPPQRFFVASGAMCSYSQNILNSDFGRKDALRPAPRFPPSGPHGTRRRRFRSRLSSTLLSVPPSLCAECHELIGV